MSKQPIEDLKQVDRRSMLKMLGASGAVGTGVGFGGLTSLAGAQSDDTIIELEAIAVKANGGRGQSEYAWETSDGGVVRGPSEVACDYGDRTQVWMGIKPTEIANTINPSLELTAGEDYTVEWTNTTENTHNFIIEDADGNEVLSSESIDGAGATQTVTFTASEEMTRYYSSHHSDQMRGDIEIAQTDEETADLIHFSETTSDVPNGAWTWYTGERAIADTEASRILVGSVSAGGDASGDIVLHWYDQDTDETGHFILHEGLEQDDHNNPALFLRPDGRYLAMYSSHGSDSLTRWRISEEPHDPTSWTDERTFDNEAGTTYSNIHRLPEDDGGSGRTYNFTRTRNFNPNVLVSSDEGSTWTYGGRLLQRGDGGDRPYPRYASDNEAIHITTTEEHPRAFNNSIYHGYLQDGVLYDSTGTVLNNDVLDGTATAPDPTELTTVFQTGTEYAGIPMTRAWTIDTTVDSDGNPVVTFITRADDDWQDHRFFYAWFDGEEWHTHHVALAGPGLYNSERDYTGLASIDPNDTSRIVISTPIDPRDGTDLDHHELFLGNTGDGGATWKWTALTPEATQDNLRPLIPDWTETETGLIWLQGPYYSWTSWDTQVVGMADEIRPLEPAEGANPGPLMTAPYGVNLGGTPENPQSEIPTVIDGLEFAPAEDPLTMDYVTFTGPASLGSGTSQSITDTDHDALYQTSIYGEDLGLDISIENGVYDVTLHFAEVYHNSSGQRVFDLLVQGETVHEKLDIIDKVGSHTAFTTTATDVEVTNEMLTISMPTHEDYSLIRGIEIR